MPRPAPLVSASSPLHRHTVHPSPAPSLVALVVLLTAWASSPAGASAQALHPRWSPDGDLIAYDRQEGEDAHLWVVGPDGRPLRATRGPGNRSGATWSPDGDRLAFAAGLPGTDPELWILELESGETTPVTRSPAREMHVAWSPDGDRLAYVAVDGEGGSELWTVGADGLGARPLTDTPGLDEAHPRWSGDGGTLLYDTGAEGERWIMELEVATGDRRPLTDPARHGSTASPVPVPGGGIIVTRRAGSGEEDLWRLEEDGSMERLLALPGDQGGPSLSPDGRYLAFHSSHEGGYGIYLLRMGSGEVVRVAP